MILPTFVLVFSLVVNRPITNPSCTLARAEVGSKWCEVITEDPPPIVTYECNLLTIINGNEVIDITVIPCPDLVPSVITEDDPRWNCAVMGNLICGDKNPTYWPIKR